MDQDDALQALRDQADRLLARAHADDRPVRPTLRESWRRWFLRPELPTPLDFRPAQALHRARHDLLPWSDLAAIARAGAAQRAVPIRQALQRDGLLPPGEAPEP